MRGFFTIAAGTGGTVLTLAEINSWIGTACGVCTLALLVIKLINTSKKKPDTEE